MPLSILLALALQTTPEAAAAPPPSPVPAVAKTAEEDTTDIPSSAPTDDYGFVSWCRGALSGHMQLYPSVKDELRKVEAEKAAKEDAKYTTEAQREAATKRRAKELIADAKLDQEQLAAGEMYLKLYTGAIEAAEAASASNLHDRGVAARDAGFRIWAAARGAEPRTRMWSWVMWELPARCETAARRLKDRSLLLGGALKTRAETKAPPPSTEDATVSTVNETRIESVAKAAVASGAAAADPSALDAIESKPGAAKLDEPSPTAPLLRGELEPTPQTAVTPTPEAPPPQASASDAPAGEKPSADAPVARRESDDAPPPASTSPAETPKA